MKRKLLKIVLLGSVPKGDGERDKSEDWRAEYVAKVSKAIPHASFIHNHLLSDSVGSELVVGHDLWLVKHADVILVNATAKVGAGTAQEMVLAKKFGKLLISIIPKNTHHRRSNVYFDGVLVKDWLHPFLDVGSDAVVENIEQAVTWIKRNVPSNKKATGIAIYDQAIKNFEKKLAKIHAEYKKLGW